MSAKNKIDNLDYPALLMAGIDPPKDFWHHYLEIVNLLMEIGEMGTGIDNWELGPEALYEVRKLKAMSEELLEIFFENLWIYRYGKMLEKRRKELE